jgi:hypothetical protein
MGTVRDTYSTAGDDDVVLHPDQEMWIRAEAARQGVPVRTIIMLAVACYQREVAT